MCPSRCAAATRDLGFQVDLRDSAVAAGHGGGAAGLSAPSTPVPPSGAARSRDRSTPAGSGPGWALGSGPQPAHAVLASRLGLRRRITFPLPVYCGRTQRSPRPASPAPRRPASARTVSRLAPAGSGPGSGPARAWNRSAHCRAPTGNPVIVSAYAEVRLRWLWYATPVLLRRRCSGPRWRSVPTRTFAHREVALAQSAAGPADGCRLLAGFRSILSMGIPARDDKEVI